MTIEGTAAVQEVHWPTVNMMRPFFTPGLRPIAETVLTAPAASVTLANIPGNYRTLLYVIQARSDRVAEAEGFVLRCNADAGANYDWVDIHTSIAVGPTRGGARAATAISIGGIEAANARANNFAETMAYLPGYALTASEKHVHAFSGYYGDASADADVYAFYNRGRWRNVNAITSLTVIPNLGPNFVAGSRFTLYGVL